MQPEPGNPLETEGVLNPAASRAPDGQLYLFPRLVAKGNYSRIGIARVVFSKTGDPLRAELIGTVLEPEADYELRSDGKGGCEDPRITFLAPLNRYIMTYTAFSAKGPRIALAESTDLFHWQRLGLASFEPYNGIDFSDVNNKDGSLFPELIPNHNGKPQIALLHRPLFPGTNPDETAHKTENRVVDLHHESIWISYCSFILKSDGNLHLGLFNSHHRLASPVSSWERLKIGGGTPPVLTRHGWLIVYHGVTKTGKTNGDHHLQYSAGIMVLNKEHPQKIHFRSVNPVLSPELPDERQGIIANVVFPTGIDRRNDLGVTNRFDIYYGMADDRIGVARLDLPQTLPPEGIADSAEGRI